MSRHGRWRLRSVVYCFLVTCFLLLAEIARFQLIAGHDLARLARDQRAQPVARVPGRGTIYDCNMRVLAGTFHRRALVALPGLVEDGVAVSRLVSKLSSISEEEASSRLAEPAPLHLTLNATMLGGLDAKALGDRGIVIIEEPVRYDPQGLAAHLIGYLNGGDVSGASGIEKLLDAYLRGTKQGSIAAFVDAKHTPIRGFGIRWLPGDTGAADVRLTIDRDIQGIVEDVMDRHVARGAVVVMDPRTGDVLAMASRPSFSPNDIASSLSDPRLPMVNRAIMAYPLGSVFKVVVAAAALERKAASMSEWFSDPGFVDVGGKEFRCHTYDEGGHGRITFLDAMAHSCNSVFIEVGLRSGGQVLVQLAEELGFGSTTGAALPFEQPGMLPDPQRMSARDIANLAIGQGRLSGTPLQVAAMLSTIASGGGFRRPRLISEIRPRSPEQVRKLEPDPPVQVLSPDTCRQLTFMLEAVTKWGTGTRAWVDGAGSCGKTGTAETGLFHADGKPIYHAWFAGFTPLSEPQLVIVVLVEGGISGGLEAAPVFAEIAHRALDASAPR